MSKKNPQPCSEAAARQMFKDFFKATNFEVKNPTDINSDVKAQYFMSVGFNRLWKMQWFRKANTEKNGRPYPWTKLDFWK